MTKNRIASVLLLTTMIANGPLAAQTTPRVVGLQAQDEPYATDSVVNHPRTIGWAPRSGTLWTAVNERDELGGDIAPDYLVGVREGGFYGWPAASTASRIPDTSTSGGIYCRQR